MPAGAQTLRSDYLKSYKPEDCSALGLQCTCYTPGALERIAGGLMDLEECQQELGLTVQEVDEQLQAVAPSSWYQEPWVIVGGIMVGLSVGGLVGYLIAK